MVKVSRKRPLFSSAARAAHACTSRDARRGPVEDAAEEKAEKGSGRREVVCVSPDVGLSLSLSSSSLLSLPLSASVAFMCAVYAALIPLLFSLTFSFMLPLSRILALKRLSRCLLFSGEQLPRPLSVCVCVCVCVCSPGQAAACAQLADSLCLHACLLARRLAGLTGQERPAAQRRERGSPLLLCSEHHSPL